MSLADAVALASAQKARIRELERDHAEMLALLREWILCDDGYSPLRGPLDETKELVSRTAARAKATTMKFETTTREDGGIATFKAEHSHGGGRRRKPRAFSVTFAATGVGDVVHVRCQYCDAERDVSDYESW